MKLYIDLDTNRVLDANQRELRELRLNWLGPGEIELRFLRLGVVVDEVADPVLAIKSEGQFDQDPPLALLTSWTESGSGYTTKFTGTPNLDTEPINAALVVNEDVSDDEPFLACMAQFAYTVNDAASPTRARWIACRIDNVVYRGDETPPTEEDPPSPFARVNRTITSRPDLTALTGGTSTALDGIVTAASAIETGRIVAFTLSGVLEHYQLTAGTTAESSPSVIRPDDYNASTNARVWVRLPSIPPFATAADLASANPSAATAPSASAVSEHLLSRPGAAELDFLPDINAVVRDPIRRKVRDELTGGTAGTTFIVISPTGSSGNAGTLAAPKDLGSAQTFSGVVLLLPGEYDCSGLAALVANSSWTADRYWLAPWGQAWLNGTGSSGKFLADAFTVDGTYPNCHKVTYDEANWHGSGSVRIYRTNQTYNIALAASISACNSTAETYIHDAATNTLYVNFGTGGPTDVNVVESRRGFYHAQSNVSFTLYLLNLKMTGWECPVNMAAATGTNINTLVAWDCIFDGCGDNTSFPGAIAVGSGNACRAYLLGCEAYRGPGDGFNFQPAGFYYLQDCVSKWNGTRNNSSAGDGISAHTNNSLCIAVRCDVSGYNKGGIIHTGGAKGINIDCICTGGEANSANPNQNGAFVATVGATTVETNMISVRCSVTGGPYGFISDAGSTYTPSRHILIDCTASGCTTAAIASLGSVAGWIDEIESTLSGNTADRVVAGAKQTTRWTDDITDRNELTQLMGAVYEPLS